MASGLSCGLLVTSQAKKSDISDSLVANKSDTLRAYPSAVFDAVRNISVNSRVGALVSGIPASAEVATRATRRGMPSQASAVWCRAALVAPRSGTGRLCPPHSMSPGTPLRAVPPPLLPEADKAVLRLRCRTVEQRSSGKAGAQRYGAGVLLRGPAMRAPGDAGPERVCPLPEVKGEARAAGSCRRTWSEADKSAPGRTGVDAVA